MQDTRYRRNSYTRGRSVPRTKGKRDGNLFSVQSISKFCQARAGLRENAERICEWLFIKAWFNSSFFSPSSSSDRFRINYWIPGTSSLPSSPSRTIYHRGVYHFCSRKSSRSSLSRYKLLKKMLPGELASFLQRRLFRGFVTFPSSVFPSLPSPFPPFLFFHYHICMSSFLCPVDGFSSRRLPNAQPRCSLRGNNFLLLFQVFPFLQRNSSFSFLPQRIRMELRHVFFYFYMYVSTFLKLSFKISHSKS